MQIFKTCDLYPARKPGEYSLYTTGDTVYFVPMSHLKILNEMYLASPRPQDAVVINELLLEAMDKPLKVNGINMGFDNIPKPMYSFVTDDGEECSGRAPEKYFTNKKQG